MLEVGGEDNGFERCPAPGPPGLTMAEDEALEGELTEADLTSFPEKENRFLETRLLIVGKNMC